MTWYFNFCAPTLPNDPAISFHRGFQTAQVIVLLIFFAIYHTYYKIFKNNKNTQKQENIQQQKSQNSNENKSQNQENQENQEKSQSKQDSDQSKSVSIAQKLQQSSSCQGNQSTMPLKNTKNKKQNVDKLLKKKTAFNEQKSQGSVALKSKVSIEQIQSFFPIVFGHHAIAMGISIMYSPYAQQSIAAILYVIFSFILIIVNSKRLRKSTYGIWMFMAFLNVFIMMSALLQVGQSNWDYVNNLCFAQQYVSLY